MASTPEAKAENIQGAIKANPFSMKTVLRRYGVLWATILLYIVFASIEPRFFSTQNALNIVRMASIIGMLAIGLTLYVCVGEFDISFAAIATISNVLNILMLMNGYNLYFSWAVCVGLGILIQALNSISILVVGIPSFIATIGMMGILTGISRYFTNGTTIYAGTYPAGFEALGRDMLFGIIPSPVISFAVIAIFGVIFLEFSRRGRYTYAVGGNAEAATHVGIKIKKTKLLTFLISGFISGFAGIVMASLYGSGNPTQGEGFLLPAIIATFLGAVFLRDGLPNARGTIVAALLLAVLENGFVMTDVPFYMKEVVQGIVLLCSVAMVSLLKGKAIPAVKV
jgi:ribose transport system permease protein